MNMAALQAELDVAVTSGAAPFVVAAVGDRGGILFSGAVGSAGVELSLATPMRIYSMTKAIGAVAVMLLVERGKLQLDEPLENYLPEIGRLQVLAGFDAEGKPLQRAARTQISLRHILTHTSGLEYESWNADVAKALQGAGTPSVMSGLRAGLSYPLTFDPGARHAYGMGYDWLGPLVQAIDGRSPERFCADELFGPLGMDNTSFSSTPQVLARAPSPVQRKDGSFAPSRIGLPDAPEIVGLGYGLWSTAGDYMKFLHMLLSRGSVGGAHLLNDTSLQELSRNQTGTMAVGPMRSASPKSSADVDLFPGTPKSQAILGVRVEADVPGMRSRGSMGWAGILNSHWWIDPAKGIAAVYMSQLLPFADPAFMDGLDRFERTVYASL